MAKQYGDIPCAKIDGEIHITKSGVSCLCEKSYKYATTSRNDGRSVNIIWREIEAVTCKECKELYMLQTAVSLRYQIMRQQSEERK